MAISSVILQILLFFGMELRILLLPVFPVNPSAFPYKCPLCNNPSISGQSYIIASPSSFTVLLFSNHFSCIHIFYPPLTPSLSWSSPPNYWFVFSHKEAIAENGSTGGGSQEISHPTPHLLGEIVLPVSSPFYNCGTCKGPYLYGSSFFLLLWTLFPHFVSSGLKVIMTSWWWWISNDLTFLVWSLSPIDTFITISY